MTHYRFLPYQKMIVGNFRGIRGYVYELWTSDEFSWLEHLRVMRYND